jgi:hypothetical protein
MGELTYILFQFNKGGRISSIYSCQRRSECEQFLIISYFSRLCLQWFQQSNDIEDF